MKLTIQTKLLPAADQAAVLLRTLEVANDAANAISARAWSARTFQQFALHRLVYADIRAETGLSAQMVVRLIAKVADAYKLDRARQRRFNRHGSIAYDERILRWKADTVSIWTVDDRQSIPFVCCGRQRELLAFQQGESDLVYRDGAWYLYATVEYTEPPESEVAGWVGIDLGIVNIAVTSDGQIHAGGQVNALRHRHRRLRQRLQQKGTKSAMRLLKRRRVKEARFGAWVNHTISKRIVADCKAQREGSCSKTSSTSGRGSRLGVASAQRSILGRSASSRRSSPTRRSCAVSPCSSWTHATPVGAVRGAVTPSGGIVRIKLPSSVVSAASLDSLTTSRLRTSRLWAGAL